VTANTPPKTNIGPASNNPHTAPKTAKESFLARLLDPISRLVECIYSVLIVLTFTLAARAIHSYEGPVDVDDWQVALRLFVAAAGCAVAWGLIDSAMYVLTCAFERGKDRRLYQLTISAPSEEEGVAVLADELDDEFDALADEAERRKIYATLYSRLRMTPPPRAGFKKEDFAGGLGVFLVAVGAAIPVLLPLLLVPGSVSLRVRASNLVAFAMLFLMGYRWGQYAGGKPFLYGLILLALSVAMMLVAIPLGG
jgi:hypothetical protein